MAQAFSYGFCAVGYDFFTRVGIQFRQDLQDKQDSYSRKKAPQYHLPELRGMQNTQKEQLTYWNIKKLWT